jgi:hypothetical protein
MWTTKLSLFFFHEYKLAYKNKTENESLMVWVCLVREKCKWTYSGGAQFFASYVAEIVERDSFILACRLGVRLNIIVGRWDYHKKIGRIFVGHTLADSLMYFVVGSSWGRQKNPSAHINTSVFGSDGIYNEKSRLLQYVLHTTMDT